jgi:hypothetical protein
MLYYISNIVTTGLYNYYKSIAQTILDVLFGASYSTGTVDWGKHSPSTHGLRKKLFT